ncbi:hypothetical protein B0H34DRAFT_797265 [Crassisporium funariophilum]|nr:hypothetical protein B0H34DRAFT_797265 [Crassisporium funariophilum]
MSPSFEPPPALPQPSRPQSDDVNGEQRYAQPPSAERSYILLITLALGLIGWFVSLVSQSIVAATISNAPIRLLWFAILIQTFLLLLVAYSFLHTTTTNRYATQIAIFASLATVFAVLGVDANLYSPFPAQKATAAGWLLTAIVNLLLILYFTSPLDAPIHQLALPARSRGVKSGGTVEKISRSTDAFALSSPNGGAGRRHVGSHLGLDEEEQATIAALDIDRLKEERIHGVDRTSDYPMFQVLEGDENAQRRSDGVWSIYTPPAQGSTGGGGRGTMSSGLPGTVGEGSVGGPMSERRDSGSATTALGSDAVGQRESVPLSVVASVPARQISVVSSEMAQWRAEALFDYRASDDDANELSFKKGEILEVIDKTGKWWEARLRDGRKGIAPSNYLKIVG